MMSRKAIVGGLLATLGVAILVGAVSVLPMGLTDAGKYFEVPGTRQLQPDEVGQLRATIDNYLQLATSGDEFRGWSVERQYFWKYSIAFAAYGVPSAMIIDPDHLTDYKVLLDTMIWKMKSRRVWGDFTDFGFGSDPISIQNIMYKGHLNLMYGLYQMTTGDLRYAREYTWLTRQIAAEMRLHHQGHYEGVTCEPNAWFAQCNTIGMLSLHIYDKLYATHYTENEVQWSLDFIMEKMRDPHTGLFYSVYMPYHDAFQKDIRGYTNAWIITFLHPFLPREMEALYSTFKTHLVSDYGPYAGIKYQVDGRPDETAHLFGLWVSKELGDVELFGRLRNVTDKLGKLDYDPETGGLAYDNPDNKMFNGGVLATKMHLGWRRVLDHDWGHGPLPYAIPDTTGMAWTDLLPTQIYMMNTGNSRLPDDSSSLRPCPNCFWGDFKSVRMQLAAEPEPAHCRTASTGGCGMEVLERPNTH